MPPELKVGPLDYKVYPTGVYLVHSHFGDKQPLGVPLDGDTPLPDEFAFLVDVSLLRHSPVHLTVVLGVSTPEEAPVEVHVVYGVDFVMNDRVPAEERENEWKQAAYHLAPGLLYPYMREFLSSLTIRSRMGPLILPFIPLPLGIPDEEMTVPPPPSGSGYQGELELATIGNGRDDDA